MTLGWKWKGGNTPGNFDPAESIVTEEKDVSGNEVGIRVVSDAVINLINEDENEGVYSCNQYHEGSDAIMYTKEIYLDTFGKLMFYFDN